MQLPSSSNIIDVIGVIGIGVDLLEIERIEKACLRHAGFAERILHPLEFLKYQAYVNERKKFAFLAKRFAAKEAIAKALGFGMRSPMSWQAVAIVSNDLGQPEVLSFGELAEILQAKQQRLLISLTDERLYAQAFAMLIQI